MDALVPAGQHILLHAQFVEWTKTGCRIEDPQHDTLAVHHRNDGHTQVKQVSVMPHRDSTILRTAALGDVQVCHDLQAADDRCTEPVHGSRHTGGGQDAINAVPDGDTVFVGFDVQISRPFANGFDEQIVDQPDDAGEFCLISLICGCLCYDRFDFGMQSFKRVARHTVVSADEIAEVLFICQH